MGKLEKNGIVELDDIFSIGPVDDVYNREEDILPINGNEPAKKDEKPVEEGSQIKEELVVDPTPDPKEDKKGEENVVDVNQDQVETPVVNYRKVLDALSSRGIIPDLKDVVFSGENGEEITINDLDFSKEDSLCDILSTVLESQKEDIVKDKIDVTSVSDITKKLIQADKAGANIVDILKQYDTNVAPIEKLDIENKADQIKIVRHYVDLLGLPKDEADEFFKGIINKGEEYVEAKAIKYKAELDKRMDDIIQQRTKEAAEKKAKDAEDFRRYKKDLKSSIQAKYQLNDTMVSKALDFALKPSESNPGITKAFNRVREMMMNPEEAPDLIMFLMNPGEFIKQKSNQAVVDEKKKIYKLISHTNKDKRVAPVDDKGDQVQGVKFDEISID
ncbi:hypothetical protein [uncultured Dialister sp.]|jgi:uncharacterized protein YlzI (FlbEa/FlbD family)|uniref:hypothetical protein n=1 Tax=uncultured Dialister sp. TaxID=278064 RepID=UPI002209153B|nr:hypothetical protein [uncultured Dialister sp.]UVY07014.1 MAG: hypothetical protein [Bacteriophage sp.]UVY62434.1 MAG: hypothetical protein [Bacteriophage sp.]